MVVRRGGFSYQNFYTQLLAQMESDRWVLSLVSQDVFTTPWNFRKIFKYSTPFLGVTYDFLMALTFLEEAPKWSANLVSVSARAGLYNILGVILSCWWGAEINRPLFYGGVYAGSYSSLNSLIPLGCFGFLRRNYPWMREMSWEVFSLPSCFVYRDGEGLNGISYLISDGIFLISVFINFSVKSRE